MIAFATTVLQLALALLMSVQSGSVNVNDALRTQAITVANSAIQIATEALNTNTGTSTQPTQNTFPASTVTSTSSSITTSSTTNSICTINSFTATPSTITAGQSTTLSWSLNNCNGYQIVDTRNSIVSGLSHTSDPRGLYSYPIAGSQMLHPTSTMTYKITAPSGTSISTTQSVTVTVTPTTTPASPITITSPNGGTYIVGNILPINWTSADYGVNGSKHVDISLLTYDPNSAARNTVATIIGYISKTGNYSWTIPSSITAGQYIVRVSSSETGEQIWGFSQPFTINE